MKHLLLILPTFVALVSGSKIQEDKVKEMIDRDTLPVMKIYYKRVARECITRGIRYFQYPFPLRCIIVKKNQRPENIPNMP
ncbi:hypothetical protein K0M31_007453 [Melipona bicolor]|uniref:Uncharacterized protein n=1 Tax=Melipona bicolor TaxID=60889 RepID=A0AA40GBS3_9HYME|nr:hypothetical protein K0M31_007453 [Melipona bicolor]